MSESLPWIDYDYHWTGVGQGQIVLTINGLVDNELKLSISNLEGYRQLSDTWSTTNSATPPVTTTVTGTGPALNDLLNAAGIKSGAASITFIGSDGYSKKIALTKVTNEPNSAVVIFSDGTLRDVIPNQGAGAWVGKLMTITIS